MKPQISAWKLRKMNHRYMRDLTLQYVAYLESIISANGLEYVGLKCFEKQSESCNVHIGSEHQINLERYSDDYGIQIENVAESRSIQQHIGHQPLVSTTELNVGGKRAEPLQHVVSNQNVMEKVAPVPQTDLVKASAVAGTGGRYVRDKHNGLQCQICGEQFAGRNLLFRHLEESCLSGQLARSETNDKAHRRRWRARQRNRRGSASRGGSRAEKRSVASRGGSTDAKVDAVRAAEVQALVEESEKTCIFCEDCTVGKEVRRLSCGHVFHASCSKGIEEWFRCCRSTLGMSPKCPRCNADVDSAVR